MSQKLINFLKTRPIFQTIYLWIDSIFESRFNFIIVHLKLAFNTKPFPIVVDTKDEIPKFVLCTKNWKYKAKWCLDVANLIFHFAISMKWFYSETCLFDVSCSIETAEVWRLVLMVFFALIYFNMGYFMIRGLLKDIVGLLNYGIMIEFWDYERERKYKFGGDVGIDFLLVIIRLTW